jgi:hypothetical protein
MTAAEGNRPPRILRNVDDTRLGLHLGDTTLIRNLFFFRKQERLVAESERAIAALQTKIDAPNVIIVGEFASPALAHDASMLQHVSTFCDGEC